MTRRSRWNSISPPFRIHAGNVSQSAADPLANFCSRGKRALRIFRQFDGGHAAHPRDSVAHRDRVPGGEFNDLTGHTWYAPATPFLVEAYFQGRVGQLRSTPAGSLPARNGWSRMQLYLDAAASFWREWIINYDASHQRALGKDATTNSRIFWMRLAAGSNCSILPCCDRQAGACTLHHFSCAIVGGIAAVAVLLIALLNLGRLIGGLRARALRAHPERAPRESAALCMTGWWTAWHGGDGASCRRKRRSISLPPFRKRNYRRR